MAISVRKEASVSVEGEFVIKIWGEITVNAVTVKPSVPTIEIRFRTDIYDAMTAAQQRALIAGIDGGSYPIAEAAGAETAFEAAIVNLAYT